MNREHELPSSEELSRDIESYESDFMRRVEEQLREQAETLEAVMDEGCFETMADNFYHGIVTACFSQRPTENFREAAKVLKEHFYSQTDMMLKNSDSLVGEEKKFYEDEVAGLSLSGLADFTHRNFVVHTRNSMDLNLDPERRRISGLVSNYYSGVDQAADMAQFLDEQVESNELS